MTYNQKLSSIAQSTVTGVLQVVQTVLTSSVIVTSNAVEQQVALGVLELLY